MTANQTLSPVPATATDEPPELQPIRRRGMLGWITKGGITVVGALAGVMATSAEASAHGFHKICCHLARNNNCARGCPNNCSFCCPSGWTKRSWGCVAGARPILCGECQSGGDTCWNGNDYTCSVAIDQNAC